MQATLKLSALSLALTLAACGGGGGGQPDSGNGQGYGTVIELKDVSLYDSLTTQDLCTRGFYAGFSPRFACVDRADEKEFLVRSFAYPVGLEQIKIGAQDPEPNPIFQEGAALKQKKLRDLYTCLYEIAPLRVMFYGQSGTLRLSAEESHLQGQISSASVACYERVEQYKEYRASHGLSPIDDAAVIHKDCRNTNKRACDEIDPVVKRFSWLNQTNPEIQQDYMEKYPYVGDYNKREVSPSCYAYAEMWRRWTDKPASVPSFSEYKKHPFFIRYCKQDLFDGL